MDVQTATVTLSASSDPPAIAGPAATGVATATATTSLPALPAAPAPSDPSPSPTADRSLSGNVAKLLAPAGTSTTVSFRVAPGSDQIVVVLTDSATGKVIAQFPSETLIALAQFFEKLDGGVVDKKV